MRKAPGKGGVNGRASGQDAEGPKDLPSQALPLWTFCTAVNEQSPLPVESALPKTSGGAFYGLLFLGLVVGVGAFVWGWLPRLKRAEEVIQRTHDLALRRVRAVLPVPAVPERPLTLSGELKPVVEASISARASGYVLRWFVDLGDKVQAGQLLAELDIPELQKELSRAKAQLALSVAARELAETTAKRWRELLASKSASAQDADEKDADQRLKEAAQAAAKAEVQRLEEISGFARITAPFAGTVTSRKLDVGQLVEAGNGRELFRLADMSRLRVFVRVPQSHARSIHAGLKAKVFLPELHGQEFEAHVVRSAGAMDSGTRTLLTELEIDNAHGKLLAGSYVQVRIDEAQEEHPLTVPANALMFRGGSSVVALVEAGNRVILRPVTLGRDFGQTVEILAGVGPSDRVIANPSDSLNDGSEVEVVP
jgi:membrane fusion protein (multidrug efflux system)